MRHTPCGCCPPAAPSGTVHFCDCTAVLFFTATPQLSLRGHTFFCLARKKYAKKRRRGREIALTRGKTSRYILRVIITLSVVRTPLRATVKSGSLSARYSVRVVMLAPVEYLTYEIRNISNLIRRIRRPPLQVCTNRQECPVSSGCGSPCACGTDQVSPLRGDEKHRPFGRRFHFQSSSMSSYSLLPKPIFAAVSMVCTPWRLSTRSIKCALPGSSEA